MGNNGKEWIIKVLMTLLALSVGFGISQVTIVKQVAAHEVKISNLEKQTEKLIGLMEKLIEKMD